MSSARTVLVTGLKTSAGLTLLEERPSLVLLLCDQKEQKVRFLDPYLDRVKF